MPAVRSKDGTTIAYDQQGRAPAVILVNGALGYRKFKLFTALSTALSERWTVINYDRRGRGDSDEAGPFAVEREIEDIAALIEAVGGRASLWGFSSGGALALRAAGAGIGVEKLAVYEAPFVVDPHDKLPAPYYGQRLDQLLAASDQSGAVKHFMRGAMGIPAPVVAAMRLMPMWKELEANAMTLPYDWTALGEHNMRGEPLQSEEWASVTVPTLVVYGAKSPSNLQKGSRALAEVLPNAEVRALEGVSHNLKVKPLAPMLLEFFAEEPASVMPEAA
jgi:pimeloyl-ACP methyl ester carboxylesterase